MSLINDALKRAQEAQPPAPPPVGHLHPVEPQPEARHALGLVVPIALAVVALLTLLLVWEMSRRTDSPPPVQTRARETANTRVAQPTQAASAVPATAPHPSATPATQAQPASNEAKQPETASSTPASVPAPAVIPSEENDESESAAVAATNGPALSNTAPVPPPLPRLQGLVYNPKRPSVVLNGKTLFTGERIGVYRVLSIGPDSVTLISAGQTNVLSLFD